MVDVSHRSELEISHRVATADQYLHLMVASFFGQIVVRTAAAAIAAAAVAAAAAAVAAITATTDADWLAAPLVAF